MIDTGSDGRLEHLAVLILDLCGDPSTGPLRIALRPGRQVWRGNRHWLVLVVDQVPPSSLVQVEQGLTRELPPTPPGTLGFSLPSISIRSVHPAGGFVQAVWDTDLYSALLPELKTATSGFEYLYPLEDPLPSQIVTTLAQEIEGGFAEKILVESLGTALSIRVARHFVGRLLAPALSHSASA